jgi:hypothetical protein
LNGFAISSVVLILLHRFFPAKATQEFVQDRKSARETMELYQDRWDCWLGGAVRRRSDIEDAVKKGDGEDKEIEVESLSVPALRREG